MAVEPKTIYVGDGAEVARLLAEADSGPLRLTTGRATYRLAREEPATIDPATFKATVERLAGSGSTVES
jgi:hypothetical protein